MSMRLRGFESCWLLLVASVESWLLLAITAAWFPLLIKSMFCRSLSSYYIGGSRMNTLLEHLPRNSESLSPGRRCLKQRIDLVVHPSGILNLRLFRRGVQSVVVASFQNSELPSLWRSLVGTITLSMNYLSGIL